MRHITSRLRVSSGEVARGSFRRRTRFRGRLPMMMLGEAVNRSSGLDVIAPGVRDWALAEANRNFLIHQSDEIKRELTWLTLS